MLKIDEPVKSRFSDGFVALETFGPVLDATRDSLQPYVKTPHDPKPTGEDGATCEIGDPCHLKELLLQLHPLVAKRKPKPSQAIMEEIRAFSWPPDYQADLEELAGLIGKYKFKDGQVVLEKIQGRIEDTT